MSRTVRRTTAVALSAALIGSGLLVAAPAIAVPGKALPTGVTVTNAGTLVAPDYTVTVDCDVIPNEGTYDYDMQFDAAELPVFAGETVTVETTNCPDAVVMAVNYNETRATPAFTALDGPDAGVAQVIDVDWNDLDLVTLTGTDYEVGANTEFIALGGEDGYFQISVPLAVEVADPLGTLIDEFDMVLAADAPAGMMVAEDDEYYSEEDDDYRLGGVEGCDIITGDHYYEAVEYTVTAAGTYSFRIADLSPYSSDVDFQQPRRVLTDPFLAVYTTFTPSSAHDGVIACNDDADLDAESYYNLTSSGTMMSDRYSQLEVDLAPGTYTLVLTSYDEAAAFSPTSGVAPAALGEDETAAIEVWFDPAAPQLAETGLDSQTAALLPIGVLLVALGGLGLATRRRWSHA